MSDIRTIPLLLPTTVRYTVDLPRADHRTLKMFALTHGVPASKVVTALLHALDDPHVADVVADRIKEGRRG